MMEEVHDFLVPTHMSEDTYRSAIATIRNEDDELRAYHRLKWGGSTRVGYTCPTVHDVKADQVWTIRRDLVTSWEPCTETPEEPHPDFIQHYIVPAWTPVQKANIKNDAVSGPVVTRHHYVDYDAESIKTIYDGMCAEARQLEQTRSLDELNENSLMPAPSAKEEIDGMDIDELEKFFKSFG